MLFACLSHFAVNFLRPAKNTDITPLLARIGALASLISMIATPTFMIVSGCVIGCLYALDPGRMPALRRKLLDRGFFLLLVGHVLQVPAYAERGHVNAGLQLSLITDVIGVAIILGPALVLRTSSLRRLSIGSLLIVLSWALSGWEPRSAVGMFFGRYALGTALPGEFVGSPLLPWIGVYLLATVLGERIGRSGHHLSGPDVEHLLARLGAILLGCGIITGIAVAMATLRQPLPVESQAFSGRHPALHVFFGTIKKFPPGPVYLSIFSGASLLLIATAFRIARDPRLNAITRPLVSLGRASFFIFVLQAYVYYVMLPVARLPYPTLWPVYYALTIVGFLWASTIWNRCDGNRFLTVGLWRTGPFARAVHARIRTAFVLR